VFHFAAATSVKESEKKPLKYFRINVDGTQNLLNCICKKKIKYLIFSSTCAVYGNSENEKVNELDSTIPISNYAKSKLLSEILIKNYAKKFSFKYAILRYFNVVGADCKLRSGQVYKGPLVKNIACNISNKKYSVKLFGNNYNTKDGTTIRDYIDVNDLSELHILSLKKLFRSKSFTLNCGYNIGYSVMDIIKKFESVIKKKIFINYFPRVKSDVTKIYSNNKYLKFLFPSWKRKFGLIDSIKSALAWEDILKKIIKKIKNTN
jgi:UDP-glucose 4-epimerase